MRLRNVQTANFICLTRLGHSYLKEFYAIANSYANDPQTEQHFTAGFVNITAALTQIKFQVNSGTFSGTIYLYGMK